MVDLESGAEEEPSEHPDSEESDTDSGDEDNPVDVELRDRIMEALQASGVDATSDDEDDEELMDDDQMMAIDEQLAHVFRSQAQEKKTGKSKIPYNS